VPGAPLDALRRVGLFENLNGRELSQVARLFKLRMFPAGETVMREGSGGGSFYVIESGEASVLVRGEERAKLGPGDHFGEIALIDEGARTASITAVSELVCYGMTLWDFRPLVERNGVVGWKLLQALAKIFRDAQQAASA
jgi:CRP/FNR family transcriptional regulator, cyclic AMP receptor protein